MMGVGEDFRALVGNLACIDLMEMIEAKGWDTEEVKRKLERIEDNLKRDLGYKDEVKEMQDEYIKKRAGIAAGYNTRIEGIIKSLQVAAPLPRLARPAQQPALQPEADEDEGDVDYGSG